MWERKLIVSSFLILLSCFIPTVFVFLAVLNKSQDLVWEGCFLRFIAQFSALERELHQVSGQISAVQPDSLWSWHIKIQLLGILSPHS